MRIPLLASRNSGTVQSGLVAEYKMAEGTGQTLWNSKKSAMSVSNLVVNGDFSNGVTGWSVGGTLISCVNGVTTFLASAQYHRIQRGDMTLVEGHKYYSAVQVKSTSISVMSEWYAQTITPSMKAHTGSGNFELLSSISTALSTGSIQINVIDKRTSGWNNISVKEFRIIDLTAIFGAGNEPTLEQCDILFSTWHDGTKVLDLPSFNGQLGSTTAVDTNDPTWTGGGLSFTTDDYVKLPYMIDAEQDFTVYLVANVGASAPVGMEVILSMGNTSANQYLSFRRGTDGSIGMFLTNNIGVGSNGNAALLIPTVSNGLRLFSIKKKDGLLTVIDIINGSRASGNAPAVPITFNQISLGCLLRITAASFSNQPEYFASFHTCATTDAEDQQQLRAVRRELLKRGVTLG